MDDGGYGDARWLKKNYSIKILGAILDDELPMCHIRPRSTHICCLFFSYVCQGLVNRVQCMDPLLNVLQ